MEKKQVQFIFNSEIKIYIKATFIDNCKRDIHMQDYTYWLSNNNKAGGPPKSELGLSRKFFPLNILKNLDFS